ncbi:MAG: glycosyltransferase family 39 protein [Euryarchaeota archaeon]|nr:glycosyltransferase family 39 protein [Euryarchaeota archaeon]
MPFPPAVSLEYIVLSAGGILCLVGLLATIAATYGVFRVAAPVLWLGAFGCAAFFALRAWLDRPAWRIDRFDLAAVGLAFVFATASTVLHHNETNAESDAGFYANDSWIIASTGGRFLTEPYDATLPHFDPTSHGFRYASMFGLPAFNALFAWLAGPDAVSWGHHPLFMLTFLSIYLLGRKLGATWGSLVAILFYGTSLVTVWLSRYVMTENAAAAIFWLCCLAAWPFLQRGDPRRSTVIIVALAWGCLVRPEGFVVAGAFGAVVAALRWRSLIGLVRAPRGILEAARRPATVTVAAIFTLSLVVVGAVLFSEAAPSNYLRSGLKIGLSLLEFHVVADNPSVPVNADDVAVPPYTPTPDQPTAPKVRTWGDYALRYEWDSLRAYYIPWFAAVAIVGILLRLVEWRRALLLVALALPYAMFLFMPPVTPQQPWFMRRLWVAWLPLVYLLAGVSLDLRNAGWRWPVRRRRSTRPRPDGAIAAAIVALVLLVPHLDRSMPVFTKRGEDGFGVVAAGIDADVPPDALLIIDEDAARFSTPLRIHQDRTIVTWFDDAATSFRHSFEASDAHPATYVLRRNFSRPVPVLETDLHGSLEVAEYTYAQVDIPAGGLFAYVANPPLEEGYEPLRAYLDAIMPPPLFTVSFRATLLEASEPLVIQKNIRFNESEWTRTPDGMRALVADASLEFNATQFRAQGQRFILHVAYMQTFSGNITLAAETPFGVTELDPPLESDSSGGLAVERIGLPPVPSTIRCPNGTVLRGIYVGLG